MNEKVCRVKKNLALRVGIALGRWFCLSAFKFCPHQTKNLGSAKGIDLLFVLIDWYKGGDVHSTKKIGASHENSPREMLLSVGIQILSSHKIK